MNLDYVVGIEHAMGPRPQQPRPEDFGLTADKVRRLEDLSQLKEPPEFLRSSQA